MEPYNEASSQYIAYKRFFTEFLGREDTGYKQKIAEMLQHEQTRLIIQLSDLRAYDQNIVNQLLLHPLHYFAPWQAALTDSVKHEYGKQDTYTIGIDGAFGRYRVSPRDLLAQHIGCLMCVEGIATRCSIVRPKVHRTVHYCEATGAHSEMSYHDQTSITGFPTSSVYPTKDAEQNPLSTEFGLSEYMDHQTLTIQEMPERAPAGLLPSSVDVVLDGDLVDACKPGDRVQIVGIYRALSNKSQGGTSGVFRSVLIANHVRLIGHQTASSIITDKDVINIRDIAKSQKVNCVDLLAKSIAPSIHGHLEIKKSILLLLLGGVEKNLDNGTHIRGDINMLLIGDPSVAKSQLLRFVLNIAPLAINTTGRGASGVGLTAAVTQNRETGERQLEAGAMVLADRGVVCIDEFDKMSDIDRVAIHEVMEQQTVTIAKAGIHMSLNARCSVVAAANPKYGQYDTTSSPQFNIDLPDSLISRFDLLFIMLDNPSAELDRQIADKVLNNHRYLKKGPELDSDDEEAQATKEDEDATPVYQKYDKLLHSNLTSTRSSLLTMGFVKKYIEFAKTNYQPILTQDACQFLGQSYAELRNKENQGEGRTMPVTARALETLIRLSSAHAKARLSKIVTPDDCKIALSLMNYALTHDAKIRDDNNNDNPKSTGDDDIDDDNDDPYQPDEKQNVDMIIQSPIKRTTRQTTQQQQQQQQQQHVNMEDGMDQKHTETTTTPSRRGRKRVAETAMEVDTSPAKSSRTQLTTERIRHFQKLLSTHMSSEHIYQISQDDIPEIVNVRGTTPYTSDEIQTILNQLQDENKIFISEGMIHRI